nr:zinc finger, CCHC-type [Tanacetum cinerariifolium]
MNGSSSRKDQLNDYFIEMSGYTDADWAGYPSTRQSTSVEITWLRNLLRELHSSLSAATLVYCDNVSATYLSANQFTINGPSILRLTYILFVTCNQVVANQLLQVVSEPGSRVVWLSRIDLEGPLLFVFSGRSGYRQVKVLEFFDCPSLRQGVEDLRELLHKGAQRDRKAEVFQVSNDDTALAQRRLKDKQPEEKTNTDCLVKEQEKEYQTGRKIKTDNVFYSCNERSTQQCVKSEVAKYLGVAGIQQQNGLVDETNVTLFAKLLEDDMDARSDMYVLNNDYRKCSNDIYGYYWGYTQAKGNILSMEIVRDHSGNTLRVSQSRFYNGKLYQMVCTRLDIASADVGMLDKFDHGLQTDVQVFVDFDYVMGRSITIMVACEVICKWKAGLKDDMDARSDVYVLSNGCRKCSDDNDGYYWEYTPDGLHKRLDIASADVGMLDKFDRGLLTDIQDVQEAYGLMILGCARSLKANLQHMKALSTTEVGYMTFTEA